MAVPRLSLFFILLLVSGAQAAPAEAPLPHLLPPAVEAQFGAYVDAIITSQFPVLNDPTLTKRVAAVVSRITAQSPRAQEDWTVRVLNTTLVNAFAGPGNYVYVTVGLLDLLEDQSELAAVLAHEVVHGCRQHSFRSFQNSERAQGVLAAIELSGMFARLAASAAGVPVGFYADASELAASLATVIVYHKYSRAYETEADGGGMEYLVQAGYPPEGMVGLFRKFIEYKRSEKGKEPAILFSTHPHLRSRLKWAEKAAQRFHQAKSRRREEGSRDP